ncbi:MAG: hypothetical protein EPO68_08725 [Planctomycetota bacterium]|nr:MAG: hypothetical protein EPO68_08725 [Planctomycetota bacterium]
MHSWLCRHRLRLAALYGRSTAAAPSAAACARIDRPRKGVVTIVPALRRVSSPSAAARPRRRAG